MVLPTYIRKPGEFFGAVKRAGLPITLVDSTIRVAPDPAFEALHDHHAPPEYTRAATAAHRGMVRTPR